MKRRSIKLLNLIKAPWVIPIVALAATVRFYDLTKSAIWHDEGFSAMLTARGAAEIWAGSARDVHPPLYYELLRFWQNLFGSSVFSVRAMSAFCGVAVVILGVWLVRLVATRRAAILAGVFLSLMPILVRYSQEARMYGVLGVFLLGATIALVYWVQNPHRNKYLIFYVLLMAAGFYTHYFTALCVLAHWIYLTLLWDKDKKSIWKQFVLRRNWLIANLAIVILYLLWLPKLFAQFTRGQGVGWIPKVNLYTLPSAVWQFLTFTDGRGLPITAYIVLPLAILGVFIYVLKKDHGKYKFKWLIGLYTAVPILLTFVVSIKKPLFIERYLVFAAVGLALVVAIALDDYWRQKRQLAIVLAALFVAVEIVGLRNVYLQANHRMDEVADFVNQSAAPGDVIISGELYTYFDFSYYNSSGIRPLLYTPRNTDGSSNTPNGYGESALLYKDGAKIYLESYRDVPAGSTVWLIGKTGDHTYYDQVPYYWQLIGEKQDGYVQARLYQL